VILSELRYPRRKEEFEKRNKYKTALFVSSFGQTHIVPDFVGDQAILSTVDVTHVFNRIRKFIALGMTM